MKALVSPNEPIGSGYRVAEIAPEAFPVGEPLFWVDCANDVLADQFWYDPQDKSIKPIPQPEPEPEPEPEGE